VCLFVLLLPGQMVLAGPPEGVSGKMVMDEISEALLRYRLEPNGKKRFVLLERLAPIQDARVTVALVQAMLDEDRPGEKMRLASLIGNWHLQNKEWVTANCPTVVNLWWKKNEADIRRRAKQLPK
jgi:hypothetical protein